MISELQLHAARLRNGEGAGGKIGWARIAGRHLGRAPASGNRRAICRAGMGCAAAAAQPHQVT